jgi:hypothetical protein
MADKDLTLRASYEDRDRVIEQLRVAAGDGRLTLAELDERIELATSARTYAELARVTADLPAAPGVAPKELVRIECTSGNAKRDGRWVVPQRMEIKCRSGNVDLDLTGAVITQPVLRIDAEVSSGNIRFVTRPGIVVDTDDVAVRSGNVRVKAPWGHDVPVTLRVEVSGKVGSGNLLAGPRRRNFWQWLTRKPHPWQLPAA